MNDQHRQDGDKAVTVACGVYPADLMITSAAA